MKLKIIESSKSSKIITVIAWIFLILGGTLSFILDSKTNYRSYIIGTPLLLGIITLYSYKIGSPTEQTGMISFNDDFITITRNNNVNNILYIDIELIELKIVGYYMEVKRNWNVLSKEIFPYDEGIDNELIIILKDKNQFKSNFLLSNKKQEVQLIEVLKKYALENHINFKMN